MMFFCWHDWPRWGKVEDTGNHLHKVQFRKCKKCGVVAAKHHNNEGHTVAAEIINENIKEQRHDNTMPKMQRSTQAKGTPIHAEVWNNSADVRK